jgi:pyruvyltransferase
VERIVGTNVRVYKHWPPSTDIKLLAIGSIMTFAKDNDVVWGTGFNGKYLKKSDHHFSKIDVRAVRGPLSRQYLLDNFNIDCPEIYGDPGLLVPYLFPEFKKNENPKRDYIIIPHYKELSMFPKAKDPHVVYPTEPWDEVIRQILDSKFVISSSLHGLVIAEAYGIPARILRVSEHEPIFKYVDYYLGTNRPNFDIAYSIKDALIMGGEEPGYCDLQKLYEAFPFEYWPNCDHKPFNSLMSGSL